MDEKEFEEMVKEALESLLAEDGYDLEEGYNITSFSEAGVLTNNKGLVVQLGNSTFQLTIA